MTESQKFLSDLVSYTKYARHLGERRETYTETVIRNADMHARRYPQLESEIYDTYGKYVLNGKVLPSMRSMQFAGKPIEIQPARMFNCAYLPVEDIRSFSEIMFLLLGGSGVGYSVQFRHTNRLPPIKAPHGEIRYLIQDSAIGWADAIKRLFKAYLGGSPVPRYDFRDIRSAGLPLKTSGGRAPGPEPLERSLTNIERILKRKEVGTRLRPVEVFDIINYIAEAVLSGGIRRSATIALFDVNDEEMLYAKSGEWWVANPQRAYANISAVLDRRRLSRPVFDRIFDVLRSSNSGEPGFFLTNDADWGTNPCGEIGLKPYGFCNLTEVNIGDQLSDSDFKARCRAAAFIGTLQAGYTDFHYLRPIWREVAVSDSLLGVSLTGIASGSYRQLSLAHGALIISDENERVADRIGIRPGKRLTTVKPSGTASLVLGTSSGIHPYWSRWQIRNIEVSTKEPLFAYLQERAPGFVAVKRDRPDTAVFSVPLENPQGGAYRTESAIDILERIKYVQQEWIEPGHHDGLNKHNVSATVSVRESEWDQVREWMWENRDHYAGITLLPYDGGSYENAPNIEITEQEYIDLMNTFPDLDLREIQEYEDMTKLQGELACAGGNCEV